MPSQHTVKAGDCLTSLAAANGFSSYKPIHDAGENADLKKKRPSPARLVPGDVVTIPDKKKKDADAPTAKSTKFKVKVPAARAIIDLRVDGDFAYELAVGKDKHEGKTSGKAPIEHPIAPDAAQGELTVWPEKLPDGKPNDKREGKMVITVLFGHLPPVSDPSGVVVGGVQGVLTNLGHYAGPVNGTSNADLETAAVAFKQKHGMSPTVDIDAALCAKLQEIHP